MRSASHSAAWLAAGMNVGLGFSASCSVASLTPVPNRLGLALNRSALSTVCITSTSTLRRDQWRSVRVFRKRPGWRAIAASQRSGRVTRVPSPTSAVYRPFIASPPAP